MWNKLPVQVWCRIQEAWGWCTGMTQSDGTGREVGGGFRMGNMCTPVADACWCMAKPIQYLKVKNNNNNKKKPIRWGLFSIIVLECFFISSWKLAIDGSSLKMVESWEKLKILCIIFISVLFSVIQNKTLFYEQWATI